MRMVQATRYVTPLREGGSLPAIIEADDDGMYVIKFRGAGQGPRVLVAELIAGEIGRALGLPIPEVVFVELDGNLGRNEPDGEVQDLVEASAGLNLALDYLPSALAFDAIGARDIEPGLASRVIWFDAYITNVDRTARNTNMLLWHRRLWLIDHGAALYFHHTWSDYLARGEAPFVAIKDHVLLPAAIAIADADAALRPLLTDALIDSVVALIPAEWLVGEPGPAGAEERRAAYASYLRHRRDHADNFVQEAIRANAAQL